MNLLIVDDEKITIDAMKIGIKWEDLEIDSVYTALSAQEAKKRIQTTSIEIVICDIEMPEENGLSLLKWIQKEKDTIVPIILTGHVNFEYARNAIGLGVTNYLLKPVRYHEMQNEIEKAIKQAKERKLIKLQKEQAKKWEKEKNQRTARFFFDLICGICDGRTEEIIIEGKKREIFLSAQKYYFLVLIHGKLSEKEQANWEQGLFDYAVKNILQELLGEEQLLAIVNLEEQDLLLVLDSTWKKEKDWAEEYGKKIQTVCFSTLKCETTLYIGEAVLLEHLKEQYEAIRKMKNEYTISNGKIFLLLEKKTKQTYTSPDMNMWKKLIAAGKIQAVMEQINQYVKEYATERKNAGFLEKAWMNHFLQDFTQVIYSVLGEAGIQAHLLFQDETSKKKYRKSLDSLEDYIEWMRYMSEKTVEFKNMMSETKNVTEKVKQYIACHYNEECSREEMANLVCLHPDYLSRLFKKETGISISEYLTKERIKAAKELLRVGDISISCVALEVGYHHFSHFASCFRKEEGITPKQYLKKWKNKN